MDGEVGLSIASYGHLSCIHAFKAAFKVLGNLGDEICRWNSWGAEGWTNNFSIFSPGKFPPEGRSAGDCWELAAGSRSPPCVLQTSVSHSIQHQ